MMRCLLLITIYFIISSCSGKNKYDDIFILDVVPRKMAVVPQSRRSCSDIYTPIVGEEGPAESVTSDSVGFPSFALAWKDPDRDLFIVRIQLDASATLLGSKADIFDPEEIGTLFGVGDKNDVKIPRQGDVAGGAVANADNIYRTDLKDFDGDGEQDEGQAACPLAFGGLALPEGINTTVGAQIRVTAIAQDNAGNQEVITVSTPVSLILFGD